MTMSSVFDDEKDGEGGGDGDDKMQMEVVLQKIAKMVKREEDQPGYLRWTKFVGEYDH